MRKEIPQEEQRCSKDLEENNKKIAQIMDLVNQIQDNNQKCLDGAKKHQKEMTGESFLPAPSANETHASFKILTVLQQISFFLKLY